VAERIEIRSIKESLERSPEEIRQDITAKRESVFKTVERLGERIEGTLDWRAYVARHPYAALGTATALGFLLSRVLKPSQTPGERIFNAVGETVEDIAHTFRRSVQAGMLGEAVPGIFRTMLNIMITRVGIDFLDRMLDEATEARDRSTVAGQATGSEASSEQQGCESGH
jgi:ElaB/YqjD/DUF883 family membrane-anchored ribosome-binding protein